MANKYVSYINNGSQNLWIKDIEARQEISNIKTSITGAMHWLGKSTTEIDETDHAFLGPFTVDGIIYAPEYIKYVYSGQGSPTVYFYPNIYATIEKNNLTYYSWIRNDNYNISGLPDTLYSTAYNVATTADITLYTYDSSNDTFTPFSTPSGATYTYQSPALYNNTHLTDPKQFYLTPGSVATYDKKEYVWSVLGWREFGDMGSLKALAFKDSASGSYTPAGSVSVNITGLSGAASKKLVTTSITGTNGTETVASVSGVTKKSLVTTSIKGVAGTESVSKVTKSASKLVTTSITGTNGTESVSKVTKSSSKLVTTSLKGVSGTSTVHDTPTLNKTSITPVGGTGTVHDTPTLTKSSIGSASGWSAGSLPSMTYNESTETLTFGAGSLPSLTVTSTQVGTGLTAGTEKTFATAGTAVQVGTGLTAGTEKTFATANETATTVATGSLDANGTGAEIVSAVTISDKTVAKAASAATTVATGAVDANGAGSDIVTAVTISDKTVATAASSNTTVATGAATDSGTGAELVSEVSTANKTVAKAASSATTVATGATAANGAGDSVVTTAPTGGTATGSFTGTAATITVS